MNEGVILFALLFGLGLGLAYRFLLWNKVLLKVIGKGLKSLSRKNKELFFKTVNSLLGVGSGLLRAFVLIITMSLIMIFGTMIASGPVAAGAVFCFLIGSMGSIFMGRFMVDTSNLPTKLTGYNEVKRVAVEALLEEGSETSFLKLKSMIQNPNGNIAELALKQLNESDSQYREPLLELALRHSMKFIKLLAFRIISQSLPEMMPRILPSLMDDPFVELRREAYKHIQLLDSERAQEFLYKGMKDGDQFIRTEAVVASRKLGSGEEVADLEQLLFSGEAAGYENAVKILRKGLFDGSWNALNATRLTVGKNTSWETLKPMIAEIQEFPKRHLLIAVIHQLQRMDTPESMEGIFQLLAEKELPVREHAVLALRNAPTLNFDSLHTSLKSEKLELRESAVKILGGRKEPEAQDILLSLVKEPMPFMRKVAVTELGKFASNPEVMNALADALKDPHIVVRNALYETLNYVGNLQLLGPLLDAYKQRKRENLSLRSESRNNMEAPKLSSLIERLISAQPFFNKPTPELLCTRCLTRAFEEKVSNWVVPRCRRCSQSDALIIGVKEVAGTVGMYYRPPSQEGTVYQVDLWDESARKFRYADIDVLNIQAGQYDLDWAINAVVEGLKNGALETDTRYVMNTVGEPEISTNARRLLGEIKK